LEFSNSLAQSAFACIAEQQAATCAARVRRLKVQPILPAGLLAYRRLSQGRFCLWGKSFHHSVTSRIFVIVNASVARWSREIRHMKAFAATLEGRVIVIAQSQAPRVPSALFF